MRKRVSFYIRRDNNASDYPAKMTHHIGINGVCAGLGVMLGTRGRVYLLGYSCFLLDVWSVSGTQRLRTSTRETLGPVLEGD